LLLAVVSVGIFWFGPFNSLLTPKSANSAHAASSLPFNQFANGPYKVQGNTILGADGKPYLVHGFGRDAWSLTAQAPAILILNTSLLWGLLLPTASAVAPIGMGIQYAYLSLRASGCMAMARRTVPQLSTRGLSNRRSMPSLP